MSSIAVLVLKLKQSIFIVVTTHVLSSQAVTATMKIGTYLTPSNGTHRAYNK